MITVFSYLKGCHVEEELDLFYCGPRGHKHKHWVEDVGRSNMSRRTF